jgi:molybdopterin molybdotransferase
MTGFQMSVVDSSLRINVLPIEMVTVAEAGGRIAAEDILAVSACPLHSESMRDGYVLAAKGIEKDGEYCYSIVGEIAAGTHDFKRLKPGFAYRIFTGGVIPEGGERVVPQEECHEDPRGVWITAAAMASERLFINKVGSEVPCGEVVVGKGTRLEIDHLVLLVAVGVRQVPVVFRPRVACFCTGSELVAMGGRLEAGQKLSLNSLILQNLIPRYGGVTAEHGLISDNHDAIAKVFNSLTDGRYDLVVTTGGMGPGKYDLVKKAFCEAGGKILLQTLPMQPGQSIILGILGTTIFAALPGPPYAVSTLVNEIVGPILLKMQGAKQCWPKTVQARLSHDYRTRKSDILQVKGGVLSVEQGVCVARIAGRLDPVSCFILFTAGRKEFVKGDLLEVHLAPTGAYSGTFHF